MQSTKTTAFHHSRRVPLVQIGDWPTLGLWIACYVGWGAALFVLPQVSFLLACIALVVVLVLQSSLSHEILHGHPFTNLKINTALGLLAVGLLVPYIRFRDTHLAHHVDERLTDPYDDPESNFCDPAVWAAKPAWARALLRFNNTMFGRMLVGPAISQWAFMLADARAMIPGNRTIARAWALHIPAILATILIVSWAGFSMLAYLAACYAAMSILKIRTFLEHRTQDDPTARTVIVEGRGVLSFLFLNNSLHVVHHLHPKVAWHVLPRLYRENKASYQTCNNGYVYTSYAQIFRKHFFKAKDPVPHPRWPLV